MIGLLSPADTNPTTRFALLGVLLFFEFVAARLSGAGCPLGRDTSHALSPLLSAGIQGRPKALDLGLEPAPFPLCPL
jgi:hypothetical protein